MANKRASILSMVKSFGMTNQMITEDLSLIEKSFEVDLGHVPSQSNRAEETYYLQFPARIRFEAGRMAKHYELFYCLEQFIREMVDQTLTEAKKLDNWWASECVPTHIKMEVNGRIKAEIDAGVSRRSDNELDFTTFGELSVIITSNWDVFGGTLSSKKAVEKVMSSLSSLRNPIAHCCLLAEDEELRLTIALRDWFRLME